MNIEESARKFAENLFVNGLGSKATRLVLDRDGTDLGGWSEKVVADLALDFGRKHAAEAIAEFIRRVKVKMDESYFSADWRLALEDVQQEMASVQQSDAGSER